MPSGTKKPTEGNESTAAFWKKIWRKGKKKNEVQRDY